MDIKKLNEKLERFIINELDKSTMDNAFQKRFDNYMSSEEEKDWEKVSDYKKLRSSRDSIINFKKDPSFKTLIGKDVSNEIFKPDSGIYEDIADLAKYYNDQCKYKFLKDLETLEGAPKEIIVGHFNLDTDVTPNLKDIGTLKKVRGNLHLHNISNLDLSNLEVYGTLVLCGYKKYKVEKLPKVFTDLGYNCCRVILDKSIPLVKGNCSIFYPGSKDLSQCMLPKQVNGDLIIDLGENTFKSLSGLESIKIGGSLIIKGLRKKLYKRFYTELQRLNLLDKLKGRQELENAINGIKPEPSEFKPCMTEYTREEDKVTFKVGDIVTCPSPGEFEIIDIFPEGHIWAGRIVGPAPFPDWWHVAELKNIKTKRKTFYSIKYLKK